MRLSGESLASGLICLPTLGQELLSQTSQAFTELINTVAPPISEHEVLQVWLTYPLIGYEGVKDVVYGAIEQVRMSHLSIPWRLSDLMSL